MSDVYKTVLFGNQKQSDHTNTVVSELIENVLGKADTIDDAVEKIKKFAKNIDFGDQRQTVVASILFGLNAIKIIKSGNFSISVDTNEQTHKTTINILPMTGGNKHVRKENLDKDNGKVISTYTVVTEESLRNSHISPQVQHALDVKNMLLPYVTPEIKAKYPDNEYAQCLLIVKDYYKTHKGV